MKIKHHIFVMAFTCPASLARICSYFIDPSNKRFKIRPKVKQDIQLRLEKASTSEEVPHFLIVKLVSCEFMAIEAFIFLRSRGDKECFSSENLQGVGCS